MDFEDKIQNNKRHTASNQESKLKKREEAHAVRVIQIQNQIIQKVTESKKKAEKWRSETIRKRSENINNIRRSLAITTKKIQMKHEVVTKLVNENSIHKDANIRVNRGLEALESFIQILRETNEWEDIMSRAVYDPAVSRTIKTEARKAIASDFFKAVKKQAIMQTEFINIAAHELRTPIMPILMNAELLREEYGELDEIQLILRNAKRLKRLTDNILNVTRIESNTLKLNFENFDLNQVINQIIQEEETQTKNIIKFIPMSESLSVIADHDRITQVIYNLINNAIKFTKDQITITTQTKNNIAIVSIEDDGEGIDKEIFSLLFTKFITKSNKGTGLGLYISQCIIEAHNGKIKAENKPNKGARFWFSIPKKGENHSVLQH